MSWWSEPATIGDVVCLVGGYAASTAIYVVIRARHRARADVGPCWALAPTIPGLLPYACELNAGHRGPWHQASVRDGFPPVRWRDAADARP